MKFLNKEYGLEIIVNEELIKELHKTCLQYYPNEFGGFLVGNYSLDRKSVFINQSIIPTEYKSTRFSFHRGNRGLKQIFHQLFKMQPSQYYIGEWHSHPDGPASPSNTDLSAFVQIVSHDKVYIENPILLLLSICKTQCDLCFYVFINQKFLKYEKE